MTTEDTSKEDVWVEGEGDGLGEGGEAGKDMCVESSTGWREEAPWELGSLEPQGDNVDQPSRIESL